MFLLFYYEPPACQAPGRRRTETKIKRLLAAKKTKIERLLAAKKPKSNAFQTAGDIAVFCSVCRSVPWYQAECKRKHLAVQVAPTLIVLR